MNTQHKQDKVTIERAPFEPVVTWRDDLWFIVPMIFIFGAFAAWRLAQ